MLESVGWFYRTPEARGATLAVLVLGYLAAGPLSRRLRWNLWGTTVAVWGLGGALVPTFVSRLGYYDLRVDWSAGCSAGTDQWLTEDSLLNLLLLVPFGVGLVWASRSALVGVAGVVTVAVAVEIGQAVSGLGTCEGADLLRNTLGGLIAVALTRGWQRWEPSQVTGSGVAPPRP